MKTKEKIFDAVKMMREIRDQLSKKYNNDPSFSEKELKRIKTKYTKLLEQQELSQRVTGA